MHLPTRVSNYTRASASAAGRRPDRLSACSRGRLRCFAAAPTRRVLPIFPLSVVALPAATVPLMIFEARYRVLFNTLLWGDKGVEEGLVQKESPFCGTKTFGMCFVDNEGRVASVGTVLEIQEFAHIQDGRLFLTTKGRERFEIKNVVKDKPVLLCEVEVLQDDPQQDTSDEVRELAREVSDLLRATIRLNVKMNNIKASEDQLEPEELADLSPRDVSFFVASFFSDIKLLQQNLLEEESTLKRLQREKEILSETVRYYSAATALKGAFTSGASDGGPPAPPSSSTDSSSGGPPRPASGSGGSPEPPSGTPQPGETS